MKKNYGTLNALTAGFRDAFQEVVHLWLGEAVQDAERFLQTTAPAPTPARQPASSAREEPPDLNASLDLLYALPASLHSEDNDHVLSYFDACPELKGDVLAAVREMERYEALRARAVDWLRSPSGQGALSGFSPRKSRLDCAPALRLAQEALIEQEAAVAQHVVWQTGGGK